MYEVYFLHKPELCFWQVQENFLQNALTTWENLFTVYLQFLWNSQTQSSAVSLQTLCEVAQVKVDLAYFSQGVWSTWRPKKFPHY